MFLLAVWTHWWHPFTADSEDQLVGKWCKAKFLQICSHEEINSSTSWMAWGWVNVELYVTFLLLFSPTKVKNVGLINSHSFLIAEGVGLSDADVGWQNSLTKFLLYMVEYILQSKSASCTVRHLGHGFSHTCNLMARAIWSCWNALLGRAVHHFPWIGVTYWFVTVMFAGWQVNR